MILCHGLRVHNSNKGGMKCICVRFWVSFAEQCVLGLRRAVRDPVEAAVPSGELEASRTRLTG